MELNTARDGEGSQGTNCATSKSVPCPVQLWLWAKWVLPETDGGTPEFLSPVHRTIPPNWSTSTRESAEVLIFPHFGTVEHWTYYIYILVIVVHFRQKVLLQSDLHPDQHFTTLKTASDINCLNSTSNSPRLKKTTSRNDAGRLSAGQPACAWGAICTAGPLPSWNCRINQWGSHDLNIHIQYIYIHIYMYIYNGYYNPLINKLMRISQYNNSTWLGSSLVKHCNSGNHGIFFEFCRHLEASRITRPTARASEPVAPDVGVRWMSEWGVGQKCAPIDPQIAP